jgi:hypothetical protein
MIGPYYADLRHADPEARPHRVSAGPSCGAGSSARRRPSFSITAVHPLGATLTATPASSVRVQLALRDASALRCTLVPAQFDQSLIVRLAATGLALAGTVLVKLMVLGVLTFAAACLRAETLVNASLALLLTQVALVIVTDANPIRLRLRHARPRPPHRLRLRTALPDLISTAVLFGALSWAAVPLG